MVRTLLPAAALMLVRIGLGDGRPAVAAAPPPVAVRAEMLTVTPATGPVMHVLVKNVSARDFDGQIRVEFPPGWKVNKTNQPLQLAANGVQRVPFAIEKGINVAENSYPLVIAIAGHGGFWTIRQALVCATAPYLDVQVDGQTDDWKDSLPVTFVTGGKKTLIRTAYTRRKFFFLVGVEQQTQHPLGADATGPGDAVQLAIAPRDVVTPTGDGAKSGRFEFLLAGTGDHAKCYLLTRPGETLPTKPVTLAGHELATASLVVARRAGFTWYEGALPMKVLAGIEPEPGREFCLSWLVHDAESRTLRDWGQAAGLWAAQRSRHAWIEWAGSQWPAEPPFDSAIEWGFCSSIQ